ncbi:MAG: EAL domain-containing protein [Desulfuromonadaceae bacterium]|nr:EAL domain-containing protein [Desulfuromonadaceae bacterium]
MNQCPVHNSTQAPLFPELQDSVTHTGGELSISLLVIDDEPRARQSLCDLLRPMGHRMTQAGSVAEAIKWLQLDNFTLALVDLNLPDGSGQDIMRYIQDHEILTRLIVISGETTFDQATEALRNGACDFLRKPYHPRSLLETVNKELDRARTHHRYQRIQDELKGSETLHRFIVNNSPDMIYMLDDQGRFSFINQRVRSLLGYSEKNLIGQHYSSVVFSDDVEKAQFVFNERRTGDRASKGIELRLQNRHNKEIRFVEARAISVELTAMGVYTAHNSAQDAEFIGTYGVIRDITERKRSEALMHYHQYHDHLTGLPNRALFHDRLKMALAQARRSKGQLAVLYLDIDRFRMINDNLGHLAGDNILQRITQRLKTNLREEDTLARVGGDEFLLLLPNIVKAEDAALIAQKIIASGSVPMLYQEQELRLTFSIGIATYPDHASSKDDLIRYADLAKCHIKQNGRNSYDYYQTRFKHLQPPALELENSLHRALKNNELELYYQPQIDLIEQRVVGLEALIRWNHPEKGLLSPGEFIPLAEQSSLICDLGEWVLERACEDGRNLEECGLTGLKIAINTSMQQLDRLCFQQQVLEAIARHGLSLNRLEIEITENSIMQDMQRAVDVLTALAKKGISIAIDDFGTGYSSLSYLQTLPISTLKIDRSFISNLSEFHSGTPIVTAILNMADALKLNCVAEGVETSEQKNILRQAGCRIIQGYHYCKPQSMVQLMRYLKQAKSGILNHEDQLRSL